MGGRIHYNGPLVHTGIKIHNFKLNACNVQRSTIGQTNCIADTDAKKNADGDINERGNCIRGNRIHTRPKSI